MKLFWTIFLLTGFLLGATAFGNGDGPPGKLPTRSQVIMRPTVVPIEDRRDVDPSAVSAAPFATGVLAWEYVVGPPGKDARPTKYAVRCAKGGGPRTIEKWVDVPASEQTKPVMATEVRLAELLPGQGNWDCTFTLWNVELGEGQTSVSYPFVVTPGEFAGPVSNIRLK